MQNVLITGSGGLVGSAAVRLFIAKGFNVYGVDNDMRAYFFGKEASTKDNVDALKKHPTYHHSSIDIRDTKAMEQLFKKYKFSAIIHCAAQPSHDWAAKEPITDFSVNATATHQLLELTRAHCPEAVFIFTSTNKVYGDRPNTLPLVEQETRFEIPEDHIFKNGINESMSLDNSKHSIFGVSKSSADLMVQEYGKYFGMNTTCFRAGCLTGPEHAGAELHGFLAYLAKCVIAEKPYTIYGYKGKQVRDNLHADDLAEAFWHVYQNPKKGEVYNIGGSRVSNISMHEAISLLENLTGKKAIIKYTDEARKGDHIWYVSDVSKFQKDYPAWKIKHNCTDIIKEICLKQQ